MVVTRRTAPVVPAQPQPPTTVREWIAVMDQLLANSGEDGKKITADLKALSDPKDAFQPFGPFGGMAIRNNTFLWHEGVSPKLAEDVRVVRQTHRIELLESGEIVDADESSEAGVDNRLVHPDNLSWVLMCLYVDWLQGRFV